MLRSALTATVLVFSLSQVGCRKSGPSTEYKIAQAALGQTIEKTMDPSYKHPDFDQVELLFRAVPKSASEYETAQALANEIRVARDRARPFEEAAAEEEREEKARQRLAEQKREERSNSKEVVHKRVIITKDDPNDPNRYRNRSDTRALDSAIRAGKPSPYRRGAPRPNRGIIDKSPTGVSVE